MQCVGKLVLDAYALMVSFNFFLKMKVRLTKIETNETWEGELSPITGKPSVGRIFLMSTYRTTMIREILSENTFRTKNSIYKWEEIK